ncbi:hypothetical protein HK405_011983, partial [Cladochytrium tenue]
TPVGVDDSLKTAGGLAPAAEAEWAGGMTETPLPRGPPWTSNPNDPINTLSRGDLEEAGAVAAVHVDVLLALQK